MNWHQFKHKNKQSIQDYIDKRTKVDTGTAGALCGKCRKLIKEESIEGFEDEQNQQIRRYGCRVCNECLSEFIMKHQITLEDGSFLRGVSE